MIRVRVGLADSRVLSRVPPWVDALLGDALSWEDPGAQFAAPRRGAWGSTPPARPTVYDRKTRIFPTGALPRVLAVLASAGLGVEEVREIVPNPVTADLPLDPAWVLRPYQEGVVEQAIAARRCMVQVATGGGKTVIAGALIARLGLRTVFLVHTLDLLLQAREAFASMFGEGRVGQIGDGAMDPREVTVATFQTLARVAGVKYVRADEDDLWQDRTKMSPRHRARLLSWLEGVGLAIADECHRVAAPTASGVLRAVARAPWRYGLSASPWRDDGADIVLEGAFGGVGPQVSASALIEQGYLVPPVIRMLPVPPESYERGTPYETVYSDYVVENDVRNALGVRAAASMVRRGRATLVLVRRLEHGRRIADRLTDALGFTVPFLSGEDDSLVRKQVIDDIRAERLGCVVASTIADEGLDVKPLSGLVLLGGGKSSTRALQRVGRVLRPWGSKRSAEVVDFNDGARYLITHSMARERIYGTEPRFIVTDV